MPLILPPRLLGRHLKKDDVVLQITEVEAYRPNDSACHGRFGITARTAPVGHMCILKSDRFLLFFLTWAVTVRDVSLPLFVVFGRSLNLRKLCSSTNVKEGSV
ncbi:uncharacterized protein LOC121798691 [Salvia splendens]|uniref:uncharacterized protein LOC121798691 n=1 Tax=Salvia splendens TaxID=180675 RepID=UPI001C2547E4|nr:uncharacterized protein LOC121798691 [Salvia splendens]